MASLEYKGVFFHASSPHDEINADNSPANELPPRIILVCFLCCRQYDLEEDLRGHMIEYHKYIPINEPAKDTAQKENKVAIKDESQDVSKEKTPKEQELQDKPIAKVEMKSMPFKDFYLILRSKMSLKCNKYPSCNYKFETPEKLQQHIDCHFSDKVSFQCFKCMIEIKNWRLCSTHLWKVHQLDVDLLKCPVCKFKSHVSVLVWRHMKVHKNWRSRVLRSMKTLAPIMEKPPPRKNKYYSEQTCEICDRKFVNGKTLSKHIQIVHHKIKPFNCNVCGKEIARKASLIIHMRQHTGEKPLSCKTCDYTTRDPSALHKHQMKHERAGKIKCPKCDYSCIQSNALKHHIRLKHVSFYKKISCDLCSYVTISIEKLKAHKEDHRKGLIKDSSVGEPCVKNEALTDCFLPLESVDSLPHEPAVDTGGVTIPEPSEESQFPTHFIKKEFF